MEPWWTRGWEYASIKTDRQKERKRKANKHLLPNGGAQQLPKIVGGQGRRNHNGPEDDDSPQDGNRQTQKQRRRTYVQTEKTNKQLLPNDGAQHLPKKVVGKGQRNHNGSKNDPPYNKDIKTQNHDRQTRRNKNKHLLPKSGTQNRLKKLGCQDRGTQCKIEEGWWLTSRWRQTNIKIEEMYVPTYKQKRQKKNSY